MLYSRLFAVALFAACVALGCGKRVLLMPLGNESHFVEFHGLGRFLLQRGHEVYVLFGQREQLPPHVAQAGYKVVKFDTNDTWIMQQEHEQTVLSMGASWKVLADSCLPKARRFCTELFTDRRTFDTLKQLKFDVAVIDSLYVVRCYGIYAHQLAIPNVVSFGTALDTWLARMPLSPSIMEPQSSIAKYYGYTSLNNLQETSFAKRLINTVGTLWLETWTSTYDDMDYLREFVQFESAQQVLENTYSLFLVNRNYVLDVNVYPEMPNVKFVGGIGTLPPQPLTGRFKQWADEAHNGLILCTFGSMFSALTKEMRKSLFHAFMTMTDMRIIVKFNEHLAQEVMQELAASYPHLQNVSHILVASRVPQNDILAHANTKIFITHSGNNGQFEAMANGVPMVAMYFHADQIDNAVRVVKRHFGVMVDVYSFTAADLVSSVHAMLADYQRYSVPIKKASAFFRAQQHPGERAADLVEQLLRWGPEFFRVPSYYQLSFNQFYNVDVHLVLSAAFFALLVALFLVTLALFRRLLK